MAKTDFGRLNADIQKAQEARTNRENNTYTKVEWFSPKFGDNLFMVLPPSNEDSHFYKQVFVHHNFVDQLGDGKEKKRAYLCSKEISGTCPICDKVALLKEEGLTDKATLIAGKKTFLYNVVSAEGTHKIGAFKPSQHDELMQEINTCYIDEGVDVTDPANGIQIKLSRLKQSPWARARALTKKDIGYTEQEIANLLLKSVDLTSVYTKHTPDELTKMLNGEVLGYTSGNDSKEETTTTISGDVVNTSTGEVVEEFSNVKGKVEEATPVAEKKTGRGRPKKEAAEAAPESKPAPAAASEEDEELGDILGMLEQ